MASGPSLRAERGLTRPNVPTAVGRFDVRIGPGESPPFPIEAYVVYSVVVYIVFHGDRMAKVGEFELLVLLAILRQADEPYANRVREDLEANAERRVTRGALYRTLDRLDTKGLIEWEMEPSALPERGGHPMRRLSVTDEGREAVRESRAVLMRFFEGLGPELVG
jgi:DNA-binding PadR family transcriptional regulator